jgi:glyoxylase-like metal-dependent hydrolase (beta-lactamase superfamily II)
MAAYETRKLEDGLYGIVETIFPESLPLTVYLVVGSKRAALIDSGGGSGDLAAEARKVTGLPTIVLHTHAHGDHVGADSQFREIYASPLERGRSGNGYDFGKTEASRLAFLESLAETDEARATLRETHARGDVTEAAWRDLSDGELIDLGGTTLRAIAIPGHTPGSLAFADLAGRFAFTGDGIADIHWFDAPGTSVEAFADTLDHFAAGAAGAHNVYAAHLRGPFKMELIRDLRDATSAIVSGSDDPVESADYGILKHGLLRARRAGAATVYYDDAHRRRAK